MPTQTVPRTSATRPHPGVISGYAKFLAAELATAVTEWIAVQLRGQDAFRETERQLVAIEQLFWQAMWSHLRRRGLTATSYEDYKAKTKE